MNDKITVSIVDDHRLIRMALKSMLEDYDFFSVEVLASNGLDFLEITEGTEFTQIILMDFEMPVMDGPSTIEVIRKRDQEKVKILGLSGHQELRLVSMMLKAGANGFISKDVEPKELIRAIKYVQEFGFYVSPSISQVLYSNNGKNKLNFEEPFSAIELDILRMICAQKTNAEISRDLGLSRNTINTYRTRLLEKTGMRNSAGLVVYSIQEGIFFPDKQRATLVQ